jgi:hypothetical protein
MIILVRNQYLETTNSNMKNMYCIEFILNNEEYFSYIERIKNNSIAIKVNKWK